MRTILFATDGSPESHLARRAAADLAARSGANLHLVTAYPAVNAAYAYPGYVIPQDLFDSLEAEAQSLLLREKRSVEELGARVESVTVRQGVAADVITDAAEALDADLVVVGSRGLGALTRLFVGSVSDARGAPGTLARTGGAGQ